MKSDCNPNGFLGMESLEGRQMLSASPAFASVSRGGTLSVSGTRHSDHITVARASKTYYVSENGQTSTFNARSVKSLVVLGGAGNDDITVDNSVAPTGGVVVNGGGGDDSIQGGGG